MEWKDPEHPLWATVRYVFGLTGVTIILWANASDFDMTEGKSLVLIALMMGGYEAVVQYVKYRMQEK